MIRKICIIAVVLLLFATSAMCIVNADAFYSLKKSSTGGYVASPIISDYGIIRPMSSFGTITQGQTNWHQKTISGYCPGFDVDINWGNPSNSLRLRIYTPDGYVLGPFFDNYDGSMDGRILYHLSRDGRVAQGTYYYEVYGYQVNGQQGYTI